MSKQLITESEAIRDEVRVGANSAKRVGTLLVQMANEVNGIYTNVLDWINNDRPQGGGFILTQSDVVNALTDESELKPLSAKQGKILKAIIDGLVVDNLVTDNESKALSARQGKELAERIEGLSEVYQPLGDYQPAGNYAASVHEHQASDIQETTDKKVMTAEERNILSTLGTKSILVESQSLGQNGYLKCSNGLLIQWGKHSGSTSPSVTIYLTESFLDADYIIQGSIIKDASDNNVYSALPIANPTKNSFKLDRNFSSTNIGVSSAKFNWIAIGRWK
ncbi:gp53-like domain-containing protein [Bacteroides finegoldii]|uniref:gp53-like domain-containing protein n=1 Tax=Bacteroides finegoldii TaxID=338188 RepID=UPI001EDABF2C|nr:hypothetical protein [Bacteroides finegoldii]MCG4686308.1 hypothetical protein [Bacteroides finegoldii]